MIQTCKECGAQIGGLEHNLLQDNVDIGAVGEGYYKTTVLEDNSEKDYCLRNALQEAADKFFSCRELDPRSVRCIRILMHLCMLVGCSVLRRPWEREMDPIFNRSYCDPGEDVLEFIYLHVVSDWNLLSTMLTRSSDDIALLFHIFILNRTAATYAPASSTSADAAEPQITDFSTLSTVKARKSWESWFALEFSL